MVAVQILSGDLLSINKAFRFGLTEFDSYDSLP